MKFTVKIETPSLANQRLHFRVRAEQVKKQRAAVKRAMPSVDLAPLLVVRLTRISPRMLDPGDNLSMSLKSVRDEIAARLKLDDASLLVDWQYLQESGDPSVRVEIVPVTSEESLMALLQRAQRLAQAIVGADAPPAKVREVGEAMYRAEEMRTRRTSTDDSHWREPCGCVMGTKSCEHDVASRVIIPTVRVLDKQRLRKGSTVVGKSYKPKSAHYPPGKARASRSEVLEAFGAEVKRRIGIKAAQMAGETFAPPPPPVQTCCAEADRTDGRQHSGQCEHDTGSVVGEVDMGLFP